MRRLQFFKDLFFWKKGRVNRMDFMLFSLIVMALGWLMDWIAGGHVVLAWLMFLIDLPVLVMMSGVTIKRLHDIGISGWWSLAYPAMLVSLLWLGQNIFPDDAKVLFVPILIVLLFPLLCLYIWPGQKKTNRFGDPVIGQAMFGGNL